MKTQLQTFGNIITLLKRLVRELHSFCAGSADHLADLVEVLVLSDLNDQAFYAWASQMPEDTVVVTDDHFGPGWHARWEDQYASCDLFYARMLGSDGYERIKAEFHTTGGHWMSIDIGYSHNESEEDIVEVETDTEVSERFWADSDEELTPETRSEKIIRWLWMDDERRRKPSIMEEKNNPPRSRRTYPNANAVDTSRRRAAAKAAKAAIEATAKAATRAAFADNDEV